MNKLIGIRKEDKNRWERRTPLIPQHIRELKQKEQFNFTVQSSKIRTYPDQEYASAGANIAEDLKDCDLVFGIKEMPKDLFQPKKTYIFFAHVIKGQSQNMPMLKTMLKLGCNLIDYEKVADENGKRLIFFGYHAGLAGMIDTLWALGNRLESEGIINPFQAIRQTIDYEDLNQAKQAISEVGKKIAEDGLDASLLPLVCGITGYGNVSQGAQEIFDLLPFEEIKPKELFELFAKKNFSKNQLYKIVFREEDMVEPIAKTDVFQLPDYYTHPEKFRSVFERYIPYLTSLVNCIYWDNRYPRLVTKHFLKLVFKSEPRLRVIGDISCDIEGSIEATVKATSPDNPVFVYDPLTNRAFNGVVGKGPVIMAIDNLPCEIPKDASVYFSNILKPFVPAIAQADFSTSFERCDLPPEIKKGVIVYQGELTPDYKYIEKYL
ncbi:MAG: bifunctional lysine ketoglutarate reductase /saccharopine dehydrogenase family protein [candidate division WOR-3 bacterium]|nr:bifunctional lysine ketoglutarate reductase /saccharopine dehydrogenase family protein [candidate division WOR-3 bacterium]